MSVLLYIEKAQAANDWHPPIQALDAVSLQRDLAADDSRIEMLDWFELANTIHYSVGREPSTAYLILPFFLVAGLKVKKGEIDPVGGSAVDKTITYPGISTSAYNHKIEFRTGSDILSTAGWTFLEANGIDSGYSANDPLAPMLVKFVDKRYWFRKSFVNRSYNVVRGIVTANTGAISDGNTLTESGTPYQLPGAVATWGTGNEKVSFYTDTVIPQDSPSSGGTARPWSWRELLTDLWEQLPLPLRGTFPDGFTLPGEQLAGEPGPTPGNEPVDIPQNYRFTGVNAWDAFCDVIEDSRNEIFPTLTGHIQGGRVDNYNPIIGPSQLRERTFNVDNPTLQGRLVGVDFTHHNIFLLPEKVTVVFDQRNVTYYQSLEITGNQLAYTRGFPMDVRERTEHTPIIPIELDTQDLVASLTIAPEVLDPATISYLPGAKEIIEAPQNVITVTTIGQLNSTLHLTEFTNTAETIAKQWLITHLFKYTNTYVFSGYTGSVPSSEVDEVVYDATDGTTTLVYSNRDDTTSRPAEKWLPYTRLLTVTPSEAMITPGQTGVMEIELLTYGDIDPQTQLRPVVYKAQGKVEVINLTDEIIPAKSPNPPQGSPVIANSTTRWLAQYVWEIDRWCVLLKRGGGGGGTGQDELPPFDVLASNINWQLTVVNNALQWNPPARTLVRGKVIADSLATANTFEINNIIKLASCGPLDPANPLVDPPTLTVNNIFGIRHFAGDIVVAAFRQTGEQWDEITNDDDGWMRAIVIDTATAAGGLYEAQISTGSGWCRLYTDSHPVTGVSTPLTVERFENWLHQTIPTRTPIHVRLKRDGRLELHDGGCKQVPLS